MYTYTKLFFKIFILITLFLITSCAATYYSPSMQVPLFKEKGELQIGGFIIPNSENPERTSSLKNFQIAYAITNSLAVIFNYDSQISFSKKSTSILSWPLYKCLFRNSK